MDSWVRKCHLLLLCSLWLLLGVLHETSGGNFNPFLDPSLSDVSSLALDQCFCEVRLYLTLASDYI